MVKNEKIVEMITKSNKHDKEIQNYCNKLNRELNKNDKMNA